MRSEKDSGESFSKGVETLIRAWRDGRAIVPLIGAGISVDSGIPAIRGVERYLAKVYFYLKHRAYLPHPHADARHIEPEDYLAASGWPDPYQLDADLWRWLEITKRHDEVFRGDDKMEQVVQSTLREVLRLTESDVVDQLDQRAPLPLNAWLSPRPNAWPVPAEKSDAWKAARLKGSWRTLLGFVTENHPGRVDALFQQLVRDRFPGTSHRFLAFLARIMEWKLVLTMNFDALIEEAMRDEGLRPDVYEVWQDAELPDPALLARRLSVMKLHGGLYGLTVGERLDQPLDEDSKKRLLSSIPHKSLILVMGWAGWDRRVMDLVLAILHRSKGDEILWVQFEKKRPQRVRDLIRTRPQFQKRVTSVRTLAISEFLREVHARLANVHARSNRGYAPHLERPLGLEPSVKPQPEPVAKSSKVIVFADRAKMAPPAPGDPAGWKGWLERHPASDDTSLAMSSYLGDQDRNLAYTAIWVNAENFQSVGGIVTEILTQIRQRDVHLPPVLHTTAEVSRHARRLASPVGGSFRGHERVVACIIEALRRGRYALAIDGIGSFARPPTIHHGAPREEDQELFEDNVILFHQFLISLAESMEHNDSESVVLLALDIPVTRRRKENADSLPKRIGDLQKLFDALLTFGAHVHCETSAPLSPMEPGDPRLRRGVTELVAFRRPRSIVAMRAWLTEYIRTDEEDKGKQFKQKFDLRADRVERAEELDNLARYEEDVDALLKGWAAIRPVEGGAYWIDTPTRDALYSERSSLCTSDNVRRLCANATAEGVTDTVIQLRRLVDAHDRIARYYYSDYYLASRHVQCLMEYFYHRVASLRFHTMHAALLMAHSDAAKDLLAASPDGPGSSDEPGVPGAAPETGEAEVVRYHLDRYEDLRALCRVIYREEDVLFSNLSTDNLYSWIIWVQHHDLKRLDVGYFLPRTSGCEVHSAILRIQQLVGDAIREIRGILEQSRLRLLLDKTEFEPYVGSSRRLAEQHVSQIVTLAGDDSGKARAANVLDSILARPDSVGGWVEQLLDAGVRDARKERWLANQEDDAIARELDRRGGGDVRTRVDADLLKRLYDHVYVEMVLGSLFRLADTLLNVVQARKNQNDFKNADVYEAAVAQLLGGIGDATMKLGAKVGVTASAPATGPDNVLAERFDAPGPRALLNLLKPPGPHVLLDGTGLHQLERLKVRHLLIQADLLIAPFNRWEAKGQSDERRDAMIVACEKSIESCVRGLEKVRAVSEVMGSEYLLRRSSFHTIKARVHALRAEFATAHAELDKAAAGLSTTSGAARLSLAVIQIRKAEFALMRSDYGIVYRYAYAHALELGEDRFRSEISDLTEDYLLGPEKQLTAENHQRLADREKALTAKNHKRLLRRSLAFWPPEWFDLPEMDPQRNVPGRMSYNEIISISHERFRRCDQALSRARTLLRTSRRSVHWWRLYYQICAQYHFENLMLLITEGPSGVAVETSERAGDRRRSRFHLRFLDHLRLGLRAIRNALDSIPAEDSAAAPPPTSAGGSHGRREERLIQLWYQFLAVKLAHEAIRIPGRPVETLDLDYLWNCWSHLVSMEHAWVVPAESGEALRENIAPFLNGAITESRSLTRYGLHARAFVERWLYRGFGQSAGTETRERILDVTFRLRRDPAPTGGGAHG